MFCASKKLLCQQDTHDLFSKVLKALLRKFISNKVHDWDRLLAYLAYIHVFAKCKVPQSITEFSSFELLYGQKFKSHLMCSKKSGKLRDLGIKALCHYLKINKKMGEVTEIVEVNLKEPQQQQRHGVTRLLEKRN